MDAQRMREKGAEYTARAEQLLAQMSLEEKVALMSGQYSMVKMMVDAMVFGHYNRDPIHAGGNERLKIPPLLFCDGPRGVVSRSATCFPVSMQRGASFDPELEERVGEAIGREVRAMGGNYFGGVCINLLRHPAGGRAQETYGEDPYHVGQMGAALVRGVQRHNVIACAKHYALNNQENARFKVSVTCDERTLREIYLPHFKDCIDAGAGSVMGAYNKFRGEHLCQNHHMLTEILKEEWGFYGFTISDFAWGVRDTVKAATAGLDVEMCNTHFYGKNLVQAVQRGEVPAVAVDGAALRIIRTLLMFAESPDPLDAYPRELVCSPDHIALALEVAEKSMVLLKNDGAILPFDRSKVKTVALIGELGKAQNIGDHGSSRVHPPYVVTPLAGLKQVLGSRVRVQYASGKDVEEAKRIAAGADAVILVVGYTHKDEGEYVGVGPLTMGGDRQELGLHAPDVALIQAVAPANKNTAVVLIGSNAILMEEWKAGVPAILHTFYPGMEGGTAIARVLFGEANPGGKLPFSIPSDPRHLPSFDREADECEYGPYHGYTLLEKDGHPPAFAFGYGLTYTTFRLDNPSFIVQDGLVTASVRVTNTGSRGGDEVVQFYVGFEGSRIERPKKLLRAFQRVHLEPGESRPVELYCPLEKLRWYNSQTGAWEVEAMQYQAYVGNSNREEDLLRGVFSV